MHFGDTKIIPLYLGNMKVCGGPVFGIIPKKIWSKLYPANEENRITISIYSLLIVKDNYVVIIDSGFGEKLNEKTLNAYGFEKIFTISDALAKHGLYTGDVTHCIISHLHIDHSGGCTKIENGITVPTFPNAKYFVQEQEYEDAISPTQRTRATYYSENFAPLYDAGKLKLQNGIESVSPFITVYPVSGHVNAMNTVKIVCDDINIYYAADLIGLKLHVNPLCNSAYDYYPLQSEESKIEFLDRAIKENAYLFLPHEPEGYFYKVIKHEEYKYELIQEKR